MKKKSHTLFHIIFMFLLFMSPWSVLGNSASDQPEDKLIQIAKSLRDSVIPTLTKLKQEKDLQKKLDAFLSDIDGVLKIVPASATSSSNDAERIALERLKTALTISKNNLQTGHYSESQKAEITKSVDAILDRFLWRAKAAMDEANEEILAIGTRRIAEKAAGKRVTQEERDKMDGFIVAGLKKVVYTSASILEKLYGASSNERSYNRAVTRIETTNRSLQSGPSSPPATSPVN